MTAIQAKTEYVQGIRLRFSCVCRCENASICTCKLDEGNFIERNTMKDKSDGSQKLWLNLWLSIIVHELK